MEFKLETPMLFAKVGWMKLYDGPHPDDPKPIGGGGNNRTNFGHEGFNFRRQGDVSSASLRPRLGVEPRSSEN